MKHIFLYTMFLLTLSLHALNTDPFIYHGHKETLNLIQTIISDKEKGAYLRIGDGDTSLASGLSSGTHQGNALLCYEEQKVLKMEGKNIIKTLPLDPHVYQKTTATYDKHNTPENIRLVIAQALPRWGKDLHVYSPLFLGHYAITNIPECLRFLQFLKKSHCSLLIGNEQIPSPIRYLLFGQHCEFIPTPARNAFTELDRIERETLSKLHQLSSDSYHVIILSLGNTGRVLVQRVYEKVGDNFFFFDFGSLMDAICGFKTRIWIRTYFNYDIFFAELNKTLRSSLIS